MAAINRNILKLENESGLRHLLFIKTALTKTDWRRKIHQGRMFETPTKLARRLRRTARDLRARDLRTGLCGAEAVDVRSILDAHGNGSFAVLLMLLTILALLPIPGVPLGMAMSIGMYVIAVSMLMGIERIKLPARLENLKFSNRVARQVLHRLAWMYVKTARVARPRASWLAGKTAARWLGAFVALMATLILLPVPFGNYVPGAALLLLALSLMFKDGIGVLVSMFVGVLAVISIFFMGSGTAWALSLIVH